MYNYVHPSDFSNSYQRQHQQQSHHQTSSLSSTALPIPLNYVPTAKFIDMESKLYRNQVEIDKLIKISLQHR
jgi:hypothetical protein